MKTFGLLLAAGALANLNAESLTTSGNVNNTKAVAGVSSPSMADESLPMLKSDREGAMDDDASGDGMSPGSSTLDSDVKKVGETDTAPKTPKKSSAEAVILSFGVVTSCVVITSFMN